MIPGEAIKRYSRHLLLKEIGSAGQEKICNAKVLVIGAGGLGCPALLYLAAAGVGTIGIVDYDKVDESNLQRQVLFGTSSVGELKTEAAKKKLQELNPLVQINTYPVKLSASLAIELFPQYDLVIDGTDNFASRYLVNDACVLLNKTLIYGAIFRFQGQVAVFNHCNEDGSIGPTYRCLFPEPPSPAEAPACSEIGVLGVLPGIIGTMMAAEALKLITGAGDPLSGELMLADILTMSFTKVSVTRNEAAWKDKAPSTEKALLQTNYEHLCNTADGIKEITCEELEQLLGERKDIRLLDVREYNEEPLVPQLKDIHIPLDHLAVNLHLLNKNEQVVVYCKSGGRSMKAIRILQQKGFNNLINLRGGVTAWMNMCITQ